MIIEQVYVVNRLTHWVMHQLRKRGSEQACQNYNDFLYGCQTSFFDRVRPRCSYTQG